MQGCHLCLISVVPPMTLLNVAGPCLAPGVTFWWCLVAIMLLFFGLFMFLPLLPKGRTPIPTIRVRFMTLSTEVN